MDDFKRNEQNPKQTWSYINETICWTQIKSKKNKWVSGPKGVVHNCSDIGTVLNDFFQTRFSFFNNISEWNDRNTYRGYLQIICSDDFHLTFSTVTTDQITLHLSKSNNTETGYCEFPTFVFKWNASMLSPTIVHICNKSLYLGVFPPELTRGEVLCIFRGADCKHVWS